MGKQVCHQITSFHLCVGSIAMWTQLKTSPIVTLAVEGDLNINFDI